MPWLGRLACRLGLHAWVQTEWWERHPTPNARYPRYAFWRCTRCDYDSWDAHQRRGWVQH